MLARILGGIALGSAASAALVRYFATRGDPEALISAEDRAALAEANVYPIRFATLAEHLDQHELAEVLIGRDKVRKLLPFVVFVRGIG